MKNFKYKKWLDNNCTKLTNKTIVVTGATGGIGKNIVECLINLDAYVILAIRNLEKGKLLKAELLEKYPFSHLDLMLLDVSSFSSIEEFVQEVETKNIKIDILINNAGIYHLPAKTNREGIEIHYATNFLGPLYLSNLLLPHLSKQTDPIIICTSSLSYRFVKGYYTYQEYLNVKNKTKKYAITKMFLTQSFLHLNRICQEKYPNVTIALSHPGVTGTDLISSSQGGFSKAFNDVITPLVKAIFMKPDKAALSTTYAIYNKEINKIVGPRGVAQAWGYPKLHKLSKKVASTEVQEKTFNEAIAMTKEKKN